MEDQNFEQNPHPSSYTWELQRGSWYYRVKMKQVYQENFKEISNGKELWCQNLIWLLYQEEERKTLSKHGAKRTSKAETHCCTLWNNVSSALQQAPFDSSPLPFLKHFQLLSLGHCNWLAFNYLKVQWTIMLSRKQKPPYARQGIN